MKNNEKVRGVAPDYEKMQADSSHQQQLQQQHGSYYQKVRVASSYIVVECYSKEHSKFQIEIIIFYKVMIN